MVPLLAFLCLFMIMGQSQPVILLFRLSAADSVVLGAASQAAKPCSGLISAYIRLSLFIARLPKALEAADSTK
ncbi:hypothetical protein VN97_g5073 [Penicillium thymicola]|uniref:Secreted protein n=1 Tax=Penicillium thymicola TaxID=293382 RepID=A0AAI9TK14_PENTH|nr:hypothetical protein VN97_g5073 [Penicillium thymicola]